MTEREQLKGVLLHRLGQATAIVKFANSPNCKPQLKEKLLSRLEPVDLLLLNEVAEAQQAN